MEKMDPSNDKLKSVGEMARRVIDTYGFPEADSSRVVFTEGDLYISSDTDIIEIIYRGTLVFSDSTSSGSQGFSFAEEGEWIREVERIAQTISDSPATEKSPGRPSRRGK